MLHQLFFLAFLVILTKGGEACRFEGPEFLLLLPSPGCIVAIVGHPTTALQSTLFGSLAKETSTHYIDDSMVTYLKPKYIENIFLGLPTFLHINSTLPVNAFVHIPGGDGYTALTKSKDSLVMNFLTASYKPWTTCTTFVSVVAFNDNTTVNGTVRIFNGTQASLHPDSIDIKNDESFENIRLNKWESIRLYSNGDLSGTSIMADSQVAVFSGSTCCKVNSPTVCNYMTQQFFRHKPNNRRTYVPNPLNASFVADLRAIWDNGTHITLDANTRIYKCDCLVVQHLCPSDPKYKKTVVLQTVLKQSFMSMINIVTFTGLNSTLHIIVKLPDSNIGSIRINNTSILQYTHESDKYEEEKTFMIVRVSVQSGLHRVRSEEFDVLVYAFGAESDSAYSFVGACTNNLLTGESANSTEETLGTTSTAVTESSVLNYTDMQSTVTPSVAPEITQMTASGTGGLPAASNADIDVTTNHNDELTTTELSTTVQITSPGVFSINSGNGSNLTESQTIGTDIPDTTDTSDVTTNLENTSATDIPDTTGTTDVKGNLTHISTTDIPEATDTSDVTTSLEITSATNIPDTTGTTVVNSNLTNTSAISFNSQSATNNVTTSSDAYLTSKTPTTAWKMCPNNGNRCTCIGKNQPVNPPDKLLSETFLDRQNVGARIRRKSSIADDRPLSTTIGVSSMVVMLMPLGLIIFLDLQNILLQVTKRCVSK